ncbi:flagellar basal-body MS-ring/collar protein FliF [Naasia sp. SYSU D00948]|uniref:flagellar basal-body MS-ring/collar protein FliF n=1 Tax=Naasia sp. SYSU D00948 TaxID=2817379 RepID=UPI001B305E00|nr:flagellar basal-body MS-ring/collar protein FliF [Naasia sp. SYSU D00948]
MPTQVSSALSRLVGAIREFTIAQRTLALIGVAVLVLGGAALTAWIAQPRYSPLFSGLSGEDASAIVDQLEADGVDYQLADGGSTILVPADKVDQERIAAAAAGLPTEGTSGYQLLDDMGVTASEFQQDVTYKRAIEGELSSTISAIRGVKAASVQLAIPEESVFVSEQVDPTASVFLETSGTLSEEQVQAIVHLTSAAVDGLLPENVSVVDSRGTLLSVVGEGTVGDASAQASDYEQRVRQTVQAMLDQVVGPGNSTVVVNAVVSNESAQRVEESYTVPEGAPALSETSTTESYSGSGNASTGVLGPDNIAVPSGEGDGSYVNESETRNNAVDKVTETTEIPAGAISRQTVSVAVNSDAVTNINEQTISNLVSAAAGIQPNRGDQITVEAASFSTSTADRAAQALQEAEAAEQQETLLRTITIAALVLAVTVVLIVALVLLRKRARRRPEPLDVGALPVAPAGDGRPPGLDPAAAVAWPLAPGATPPQLGDLPTVPLGPLASQAPSEFERIQADINALAGSDPGKTADYLRALMDDRQAV